MGKNDIFGGWSEVNENTSTEGALGINIKTDLDTNVSGWDRGGDSSGGFGWGNVKSDF